MADRDSIMRDGGYMPVPEAAVITNYSAANIYRLIREDKIESAKYGEVHYVLIKSLAEYIGPVAAKLCGLEGTPDEQ